MVTSFMPSGIQTFVMQGVPLAAAKSLADLAAGDAVLDPEAADALVAMGQRETVGGLGMREEGGVEVQSDAPLGRPVHPTLEMFRLDLVAFHPPAAVLQINGMEAEAVFAGKKAQGLFGVGPQLVGMCGPGRDNCRWP